MYLGGCACKTVSYQFSGEPLTCFACHCTDCQTSSGSAFALSMIVNSNDFKVIGGQQSIKVIEHNSTDVNNGTGVKRHDCGKCNTALWFSAETYPEMTALVPGTFNDSTWFAPIAHQWVGSAQAWVTLSGSAKLYDKSADMADLMQLWVDRENA